jgi:hypothetical protein
LLHRSAALIRRNNPLKGISSGDQMLASIPASILNHIRTKSGVLFD